MHEKRTDGLLMFGFGLTEWAIVCAHISAQAGPCRAAQEEPLENHVGCSASWNTHFAQKKEDELWAKKLDEHVKIRLNR